MKHRSRNTNEKKEAKKEYKSRGSVTVSDCPDDLVLEIHGSS